MYAIGTKTPRPQTLEYSSYQVSNFSYSSLSP